MVDARMHDMQNEKALFSSQSRTKCVYLLSHKRQDFGFQSTNAYDFRRYMLASVSVSVSVRVYVNVAAVVWWWQWQWPTRKMH